MRASLTIGGIEVAVRAPDGPLESVLADRYAAYLGAVVDPVCSVRFESSGVAVGLIAPVVAAVDDVNAREVRVTHPDFDAAVDLEGRGIVRTAHDPYTIDHFLRLLFALLAPRHEALLLRACGVIANGRAHVLVGASGDATALMARHAGSRPVLSDELVMVRRVDGAWTGASTPFWNGRAFLEPPRRAPLAGVWLLQPAADNIVVAMDQFSALRVALEHAVLPSTDARGRAGVFPLAADLARAVHSGEARCFTPDSTVWDALDAAA